MATRFYLPSTGAAAVSPAFPAGFEHTSEADRLKMVTTKIVSAMASKAVTKQSAVSNEDVAVRMYVSDPLSGAQTITGTAKGQILALESNAAANAVPQQALLVVTNDGSTVRGTLIDLHTGTGVGNEFSATTLTNRKYPRGWAGAGAALSSVSAQDGDRIVLVVATRLQENSNVLRTMTFRFGDAIGSDLPEDEVATAEADPWFELSQTLTFQSGSESHSGSGSLTATAAATASGAKATSGSSTASATAAIVATAAKGMQASAAITGAATVTAIAAKQAQGVATVTAGSTVTASGTVAEAHSGAASLTSSSAVAVSGSKAVAASETVASTATVSVSGAKSTTTTAATVTASAAVTATGSAQEQEVHEGSAVITASSSVSVVAVKGAQAAAVSIAAVHAVLAVSTKATQGSAAVSATAAVAAAGGPGGTSRNLTLVVGIGVGRWRRG